MKYLVYKTPLFLVFSLFLQAYHNMFVSKHTNVRIHEILLGARLALFIINKICFVHLYFTVLKHWLRNKESIFEYCEAIILVRVWSNLMKPKGLYDYYIYIIFSSGLVKISLSTQTPLGSQQHVIWNYLTVFD